jgi:hypothetical protein
MIGQSLILYITLAIVASLQDYSNSPGAVSDSAAVLDHVQRREMEQESLVRKLKAIAADENGSPDRRAMALESLGKVGTRSAVIALLDHLLVPAGTTTNLSILGRCPAAEALASVGSAAYPQIWERINGECSERYLFVLGHTINQIDGKAVATARLREKRDAPETTRLQKANLERLLRLFETVDLKHPQNRP